MPHPTSAILLLFHTLARDVRFAGNTQLAMVAGELARRGIEGQTWVLLMRPDDEERNAATLERFLEAARDRRPDYVVAWANWLPWLPQRLRDECGARVISLDPAQPGDIPAPLRELDPMSAVIATVAGAATRDEGTAVMGPGDVIQRFEPRFDYRFLGADPVPQEMAHVAIRACPYGARIEDNPHYQGLEMGPEVADRGCAYCNAAWGHRARSEPEKARELAHQVRVLQRSLPALREIAIPFPEDYVSALTTLLRGARDDGLRPVMFSGQFNAESVAHGEAELDAMLTAAREAGFAFHIGVVGLESFRDEDLARFNRGTEADVRGALAVLRRLRVRHDPAAFMPDTVGSFIPFHPWQTLAGLRHTADAIGEERVEALFSSINLNDARFHPGVAMYHRARADGLLVEDGDGDVHGVPLGGYFAERRWRFVDDGVAAVHRLYAAVQERTSQKVGLLDAALRAVERSPEAPPEPAPVAAALQRMARLAQDRGAPGGDRHALSLAGPSNVGYAVELDAGRPRHETVEQGLAALQRAGGARGAWITLCGPEPTLRRDLPEWIEALRGEGAATVEVLTHGRMLAYERYAEGLLAAGVGGVAVLLHHTTAADHDAVVRVPGAFEQATDGLRRVAAADRVRATVAVVVTAANLGELDALADLAAELGADELRLMTPWATLPLADLGGWLGPLQGAMDRATARGLLTGIDRHFRAELARDREEDEA